MDQAAFEWDHRKNEENVVKHGLSFFEAQLAFLDPNRIIAEDVEHSKMEIRYYCFGRVDDAIVTVRFTYIHKQVQECIFDCSNTTAINVKKTRP